MRQRHALALLLASVFIGMASDVLLAEDNITLPKPACVSVRVGDGAKLCIAPGSGKSSWFKDCSNCPEMVIVPSGRFTMGSPLTEEGRSLREDQKAVRIAAPFAVGRFSISFDEWKACLDEGGCNAQVPDDRGWGRGRLPVINVSWDDALAFTRWLSRKTGKRYRLLSSAEREYVARAGTTSAYWMGDAITIGQANFDLPVPSRRMTGVDMSVLEKVRHRTAPVDSFEPNPWGLYSVHGNVWEWTRDCVASNGRELTRSAPTMRAPACGQRVARGGSWNDFATEARSAAWIGFAASSRNLTQGFRVARDL